MSVKIVKVVETVPNGSPGDTIVGMIQQGIMEAARRVRQEGGIMLPKVKVLVTIEQEYETGN